MSFNRTCCECRLTRSLARTAEPEATSGPPRPWVVVSLDPWPLRDEACTNAEATAGQPGQLHHGQPDEGRLAAQVKLAVSLSQASSWPVCQCATAIAPLTAMDHHVGRTGTATVCQCSRLALAVEGRRRHGAVESARGRWRRLGATLCGNLTIASWATSTWAQSS